MKNLLILLFVTGSMICTGQEENQKSFQNSIAIGAGIGSSNRYGLSYQRELKNNWRLQGSIYMEHVRQDYDYSFHYSIDSSIVHVRTRSSLTNRLLKLGGMKTFYEKFFIGADLNIGYQTRYLRRSFDAYSYHYDSWNDYYELSAGDTLQGICCQTGYLSLIHI